MAKSKKSKEEIGNGKIFIGIPRERMFLTQFVDNRDAILTNLAKSGRGGGYFQAEGHRVDRNRDQICEDFLKRPDKPEWLVMIDTDMEHPIDAPLRLTSYGKPIVGALYFHRGQTHEPFAFKEVTEDVGLDDYGRPALMWRSMKKEVYEFLERNMVPMRDGAFVIDGAKDSLVECDAVATGCMAIHRSVLERMPKPIFEYRYGGNSEDLVFCREAKMFGFPIYCDFSTICGHFHWVPMGQAQFRMNYINLGINATAFSLTDAALWYANFYNVTKDEATAILDQTRGDETSTVWRSKFGENKPSPEEVKEFYRSDEVGNAYVLELLRWNYGTLYNQLRQRFVSLRNANVIEIGAGIGSLSIQLTLQGCNVLSVEVNPVLRKFIAKRYNEFAEHWPEYLGQISIVDDTWKEKCENESFDNVVSLETFEHLPVDELKDVLFHAHRVLKVGGSLGFSANFGQLDTYPSHYNHSEWFGNHLLELGFMAVSEFEYMKVR